MNACSCANPGCIANGCQRDSFRQPFDYAHAQLPVGTYKFKPTKPKPITEDDLRRILREEIAKALGK